MALFPSNDDNLWSRTIEALYPCHAILQVRLGCQDALSLDGPQHDFHHRPNSELFAAEFGR
jgi:hypothetical protein